MANLYRINGLLDHLLREDASELDIVAESPPSILVQNERVAVGSASITNDNVANLLYNLATVDQMRELNICGDVRFIFLFRNWARFSIVASTACDALSIKIKYLGR